MKTRYIISTILACFALLCGCSPMEIVRTTDDVKVEPSYLEIAPDGGEVKSTVIATGEWTITEIPEWLTVSPVSGAATDEKGVQVKFSADVTYESRSAQVLVNVGKESYMITIKQGAAIAPRSFEAGDYWIIAKNSEGKNKAAMPVASGYGYLAVSDPEEVDGKLQGKALNIFTFTEVEGGYTITDTYGNYYYLNADYDSFNVSQTEPTDGSHIWTVEAAEGDTWKIMNSLKGKYIQLDASYGTYGCYSASKGTMPLLVKVEIEFEPEPLGDATEIKDATEIEPEIIVEGLVTASSTKGVIVTDKTGSLLVYGINSEVKVGDALKVKGNLSSYNKGYQLANPYQYEIASSDNKIEYPEPVVLKADAIAEMVKPTFFLAQYASVTGRVSVDSYNNALIKVGQYTVKTYYSHDSYADFADKGAEICGYVVAYKESSKEVSMVVTSIKEVELPSYSIDGKQWKFYWEDFEMLGLLDMGVTAPGKMVLAFQYDGDDFYTPYVSSEYVIEEVDEVSGKVIFEEWGEEVVLEYSELSESSVVITCDYEWIYDAPCTLAETLETIQLEEEGGFKPGAYYITTEGGMFAMPVAEEYTYGYLKVTESVSSSLVFTIEEYDADFGSYTIKDSYGRYLYQTEGKTYTNYNVSTEFDEAEWGYQWFVQPNDDGTYTIKNAGTYYYMQYDPNYSSFGCYEDERGSLPVLIPAE